MRVCGGQDRQRSSAFRAPKEDGALRIDRIHDCERVRVVTG